MPSFAIVVFTEDSDAVSLVPEVWCIGKDNCYWPPYKSILKFERAVRSCEPPSDKWGKHPIRILQTTDTYEKGLSLVKRAEDTSDLQTEAENGTSKKGRKRKKRSRYISDSDSEEGEDGDDYSTSPSLELPSPPTPPATLLMPSTTSAAVPTTPTMPRQLSQCPASSSPGPSAAASLVRTSTLPGQLSQCTVPSSPVPSTTVSSVRTTPTIPLLPRSKPSISHPVRNLDNFTAAEKSMLTLLMEVKAELKEVKSHVKHLLNINQSTTTEDEEEDIAMEELSLPCTDVDELFQLDEKLKINKTVHKQLLSILSTTGGRTLREVINRMMRELMLNCVAIHFNWTGQGSKHSFRDLALRHVMERAVRRNTASQTSSGHEIKVELCHYLKGAPDRDGGRQARRKPLPEPNE